ncbi:GNAT family N-acetyltransferase [Cellulomonas sp.]|uniref:GNAT family N-acetyltransferase n=1 Tax=Cellulomonas sp. TaxID=40001 RepID=UPI002811EFAB|nr:GNAT family N-acetyltransferase [Cellulomonas sp.]
MSTPDAPARTVAYRDATGADVAAVVSLVDAAYRGEASRAGWTTEADLLDGQRTDTEAVAEILADPGSRLLLAVGTDGVIVGCCHVRRTDATTAYLGSFAVRPGLQGAGTGGALMREAERRAVAEWRSAQMEMTVIAQRPELIGWYERRGYVRTGETRPFPYGDERFGRPRRDDLVFVVLRKDLATAR